MPKAKRKQNPNSNSLIEQLPEDPNSSCYLVCIIFILVNEIQFLPLN
jgi:hypothetical protein